METKICSECKKELPLTEKYFYKRKSGRISSNCKLCVKNSSRQYYYKNKEKVLDRIKIYYKENKSEIRKYQNEYRKERCKTDYGFKAFLSLRSRLVNALNGKYKSATTKKLIGCNTEKLKLHLESQFIDGMNWDNYGKDGWEIDHIIPCASFDLSIPENQRKCFHYTNLRPLWARDNLLRRFN